MMALTISEASAVNQLVDWIIPDQPISSLFPPDQPPTDTAARESLELLARSAKKALMAGADDAYVRKHWRKRRVRVAR
jgi:hypothetical protein